MPEIVIPKPKPLVDLNGSQAIVTPEGRATAYFLRYLFDRGGYLTQQEQALLELLEQLNSLSITAGGALSGGGLIVDSPTISLDALSPDPSGTYTNMNATIDEYGRVTTASSGATPSFDFLPSVPLTRPVAADYSIWVNQGGSTVTDGSTGMLIEWASMGGGVSQMRAVYKSLGSATVFEAFMLGAIPPEDFCTAGISLRESGTGKMFNWSFQFLGPADGFGYCREYWSAYNARTNFTLPTNSVWVSRMPWTRVVLTGGNILCQISETDDGNDWVTLTSVAITTPFTTAPDQVGFCSEYLASGFTAVVQGVKQL